MVVFLPGQGEGLPIVHLQVAHERQGLLGPRPFSGNEFVPHTLADAALGVEGQWAPRSHGPEERQIHLVGHDRPHVEQPCLRGRQVLRAKRTGESEGIADPAVGVRVGVDVLDPRSLCGGDGEGLDPGGTKFV